MVADVIRQRTVVREKEVQDVFHLLGSNSLPGDGILGDAIDLIRAIRTGSEDQTILTFNTSCKELKEAIKRAAELSNILTPPAIGDIRRAKTVIDVMWPFLSKEADLDFSFTDKVEKLMDLLSRETFFRDLPEIDQLARDLEQEYKRRFDEAAKKRKAVYAEDLEKLEKTPGWEKLSDDQKNEIRNPIEPLARTEPESSTPIMQLRADIDAADGRFSKAVEEMMRILDGARLVRVSVAKFFSGGVETQEQLEAALSGLREECERLIGAGKKVLIQ